MSDSLLCKASDGTWFVFLEIEAYRAAIRRGSPVPIRELGLLASVTRGHCGSQYGYRLHADHGEQPCQSCLAYVSEQNRLSYHAHASR
jgi:hypothetical protein